MPTSQSRASDDAPGLKGATCLICWRGRGKSRTGTAAAPVFLIFRSVAQSQNRKAKVQQKLTIKTTKSTCWLPVVHIYHPLKQQPLLFSCQWAYSGSWQMSLPKSFTVALHEPCCKGRAQCLTRTWHLVAGFSQGGQEQHHFIRFQLPQPALIWKWEVWIRGRKSPDGRVEATALQK